MQTFLYSPILNDSEKKYPYYITTMGINWEETLVDRENGYPDYQFIFSAAGSGCLKINGKTYPVASNTVMCLPANVPHKYYPTTTKWVTHWISFNGMGVPELFPYSEPVFPCEFNGDIADIFEKLKEAKANNTISEQSTFYLYALLILCRKILLSDSGMPGLEKRLEPVFRFMEEHFKHQIDLQELAGIIHVTPAHFCRLFKTVTGMRPFEYLNRLKLQKAKELLLLHRECSVKEIGAAVGFESESYFGAQFKKYEKSSPKKFRELYCNEG